VCKQTANYPSQSVLFVWLRRVIAQREGVYRRPFHLDVPARSMTDTSRRPYVLHSRRVFYVFCRPVMVAESTQRRSNIIQNPENRNAAAATATSADNKDVV